MAITLTEKVKLDLGGISMKVFVVTALSGDLDATISAGACGMNQLKYSEVSWITAPIATNRVVLATLKTPGITTTTADIVLSGLLGSAAPDAAILTVYGY